MTLNGGRLTTLPTAGDRVNSVRRHGTTEVVFSFILRQFQKTRRKPWTRAGVFMFEKDIRLAPRLRSDSLNPRAQVLVGVLFAAQSHVTPIGCADEIGER